ncbi:RNA polymerase sigma factor [Streptomyces sp. NPDC048496]|uniref:RNA polymerase sigma factor n=1 Tax=Streptomyces sp. NPDC048496 TaxID=3365558 RepID=UPI003714606E
MSDVDTSWFDDYFDSCFDRFVWRSVRAFNLRVPVAEEVVQGVFEELCRSARAGKIDASSSSAREGFMWQRITWRVTTHWRNEATERGRRDAAGAERLPELCAPATSDSTPELAWEDQAAWKAVQELVAPLPPRQRHHAGLVALGYKPQERAQALGMKEGAERVAWHRLRQRLAGMIGESGTGEERA